MSLRRAGNRASGLLRGPLAAVALGASVLTGCSSPPPPTDPIVTILSVFPTPESEPNGSITACDTTSWARNFDLIPGPGVPAPYSYGGSGRLSPVADVDYWCAYQEFSAGDTLIAVTVTEAGSEIDPVLALYGPGGDQLSSNDNGNGANPADARLSWRIESNGRYYVRVSAASPSSGSGRYSIFMHVGRPGTLP
jgi:hypothetical protein